MKIDEIRDLDGPNLFMPRPAIKLEIDAGGETVHVFESRAMAVILGDPPPDQPSPRSTVSIERLGGLLDELIHVLHDRVGQQRPLVVARTMEEPHHLAVAFGWHRRRFARAVARLAFDVLDADEIDVASRVDELTVLAQGDPEPDDVPEMHRDSERRVPVIGITGTNGKTTTTRLIAAILMGTGRTVGWTSSAGVYIGKDLVLEGDYTGPAGAARVFEEPSVDVAVLETARGGILLRGLGYESNDVSVVTNISADHLGLHGVHSVETLAEVKQVVTAVTREAGFAVLNAGDPLALAMREGIRAQPFLVTREGDHPDVVDHVAHGGWALSVRDGQVIWNHDGAQDVLTTLNEIPIAFGGRAAHMLENALCAAAACLGLGLDLDAVRSGLAAFRNQSDQNRGRLNVYELDGKVIIVDFAHNELGLKNLLAFGRTFVQGNGKLISVIGTAGDRGDEVLRALGRIAGEGSDVVIAKDTVKYLRGRSSGEIPALIEAGLRDSGTTARSTAGSELEGYETALEMAGSDDVIALMCIEDYDTILPRLESTAKALS